MAFRIATRAVKHIRALVAVGGLFAALVLPSAASPTDPTVKHGNVVVKPGPNVTTIEQLTSRAIIDWRSFSINPNEAVRILQPGQLSIILNRVTGGDPSIIRGQLSATGQVFLLNPNGVLFTPTSVVNTAGLLVSTLKMSDSDFLAGRYNLSQDPNAKLASVVNQGTITVTDGGYAVLTAPLVSNEGLIVCNLGKVVLGAGEKITLNFDGRNLINWSMPGMTGKPGTVVVPQAALSTLLSQVITNHSVVEAGSMAANPDGTVSLVGASGVAVNNGIIRVDGLGGSNAGAIDVHSTQATVTGPSSVLSANGSGAGSNGGSIKIDSDGTLVTRQGRR